MARPIRIEYAGALYHVTSRGDRREDIFVDDEEKYGVRSCNHAFVLIGSAYG